MASAIRTEALSKTFGHTKALISLDLEVPEGEVLGYLGPNGAGKTTTIRLAARPDPRDRGTGGDLRRGLPGRPGRGASRVAYVPGEANLWPSLTGTETLHLLGSVSGHVDTAYRDQLIERFEFDPSRKVRAYSKGNRQKLLLIAGLMTRADLLLLDEPTSGLDPLMERAFRDCAAEARERGQTIFLSSHIMSEVEALCDRIAILRAGRLVEVGTLAEMRHLSALTVEAEFDGSVPDLSSVPGVDGVAVDGNRIRCQVIGSVEPLLGVLVAPASGTSSAGSPRSRSSSCPTTAPTAGRPMRRRDALRRPSCVEGCGRRHGQEGGQARGLVGTALRRDDRRDRSDVHHHVPDGGLEGETGALGAGQRRVRGGVRADPALGHRGRLHGVQGRDHPDHPRGDLGTR